MRRKIDLDSLACYAGLLFACEMVSSVPLKMYADYDFKNTFLCEQTSHENLQIQWWVIHFLADMECCMIYTVLYSSLHGICYTLWHMLLVDYKDYFYWFRVVGIWYEILSCGYLEDFSCSVRPLTPPPPSFFWKSAQYDHIAPGFHL